LNSRHFFLLILLFYPYFKDCKSTQFFFDYQVVEKSIFEYAILLIELGLEYNYTFLNAQMLDE